MLEAELASSNGGLKSGFGEHRVASTTRVASRFELQGYVGRTVILGIGPRTSTTRA